MEVVIILMLIFSIGVLINIGNDVRGLLSALKNDFTEEWFCNDPEINSELNKRPIVQNFFTKPQLYKIINIIAQIYSYSKLIIYSLTIIGLDVIAILFYKGL
jgi:hypothetical protein